MIKQGRKTTTNFNKRKRYYTMTKKEIYASIINYLNGENCAATTDEMIDLCNKEIERASKRYSSDKPTKAQVAAEADTPAILEILAEAGSPMTVTDITAAAAGKLTGKVSGQRITSILKKAVDAGKVENIKEGRTSTYSIVE
jgi:hypothetical protein